MKSLRTYISEELARTLASVTVSGPTLDEVNAAIVQYELDDVLTAAFADSDVIVSVPEDGASDDDYAEAYLKELINRAPDDWRFGEIKKTM